VISNESKKGANSPNYGKHPWNFGKLTPEETKRKMSERKKGKRGAECPNYKGGKKLAQKRMHAKRRKLGSTFLLVLRPGEVGHHISNECIIGIPEDVHNSFGGRREKHRALVLEWLKENDPKKYRVCIAALETLFGYL